MSLFPYAMDGLGGQEDELDDVAKGKLDPPTNTEGSGSLDEANEGGRALESEDEDNALVREEEGFARVIAPVRSGIN